MIKLICHFYHILRCYFLCDILLVDVGYHTVGHISAEILCFFAEYSVELFIIHEYGNACGIVVDVIYRPVVVLMLVFFRKNNGIACTYTVFLGIGL